MKIIKENSDMMKTVVQMNNGCGHTDYYGCFVMRNGINFCRKCIYEMWKRETNYKWQPQANDYIFPLYSDGIDYEKEN